MKIFFKNKRARLSTVFLVLLTLVGSTIAIFLFATSNAEAYGKIYTSNPFNGVYSKEDLSRFYIEQAGENAIDETRKSTEDMDFFKIRFKENFQQEFVDYSFREEYLINLKNQIKEGNFEVYVQGDVLFLKIRGLELKDSLGEISFNYKPEIELEFELESS